MFATTVIAIHLLAASLAIVIGLVNLVGEKGTRRHRRLGRVWLVLMIGISLSSFGIRGINDGGLSWVHILSVWTLISVLCAWISIRQRNIRRHAGFMIGTMIGAGIAGVFALAPGRFISHVLGYG